MDKTFQKLLQTDIELSSLGVERRTDNEPYFCTPKGASVFGWTGVDGIHFCFVRSDKRKSFLLLLRGRVVL